MSCRTRDIKPLVRNDEAEKEHIFVYPLQVKTFKGSRSTALQINMIFEDIYVRIFQCSVTIFLFVY